MITASAGSTAHRMNRRRFLWLAAGVVSSVGLAACGATPTPTPVPPTATRVPPTATPVPPTATRVPPTATVAPPTATAAPQATAKPAAPATATTVAPAAGGGKEGGAVTLPLISLNPDVNVLTSTSLYIMPEIIGGRPVSLTWDKRYVADLAEKWDVSSDARTYTFYLRKGLKWHDGRPLTADDVEWTYTTGLNPKAASWVGNMLTDIQGADEFVKGTTDKVSGIKVVDPQTVQIQLKAPSGVWPVREFKVTILPKHILGSTATADLGKSSYWTGNRIDCGPFKLVKYTPQQNFEFTRYDDYHLGKPLLEKVFLRMFANSQTALLAFEKGEIDLVEVPLDDLERTQKLPNTTVLPLPAGRCNMLFVNLTKPEFQNKAFRQALAYAIDRATITKTLFKGQAIPLNAHFVQSWAKNPSLNPYAYNPDKAKALLKEAKWDPSRVIELMYWYTDNFYKSVMETMQQYLDGVGVKSKLRLVDQPIITKEVFQEATYDLAFGALGVPVDPDECTTGIDSRMIYPAGSNWSRYKNPQVDDLMQKGRQAVAQAERQKYYYQVETILNDELPYIWLFEPLRPHAANNRVLGLAEHQGVTYFCAHREMHKWSIKG